MKTVLFIYHLFNFRQWFKNTLIFVPAFFAASFWKDTLFYELSIVFLGFSLLTSGVYLLNDLNDKSTDILHPFKKKRLIASGRLTNLQAIMFIIAFISTSFTLLGWVHISLLYLALIYLGINILYSFALKKIPLIDIVILLSGYVIRLFMGGVAASVPLSPWVILLTLVLASYLILIKRHSDVLLKLETCLAFYKGLNYRMIFNVYTFLIPLLYVSYIIAVHWDKNQNGIIILSIPIVAFILFRFNRQRSKFPHKDPLLLFLTDVTNLLGFTIWLALFTYFLYKK